MNCSDIAAQITTTSEKLTRIKSAIAKANAGICDQICELNEIKNRINFLNSLPTREGEEVSFVGRDQEKLTFTWTAFLNREEVDKRVADAQLRINELQDTIDVFNASTEIGYQD